MPNKLQPKAIFGQELTVINSIVTLGYMDDQEKIAFSARLNELCDEPQFGIPAAGKGRQVALGRIFGVSQNAARKWLIAEGMPRPVMIERIARHFVVMTEWLRAGQGVKRQKDGVMVTDPMELRLLETFRQMNEPDRAIYIRMGGPLAEPAPKERSQ